MLWPHPFFPRSRDILLSNSSLTPTCSERSELTKERIVQVRNNSKQCIWSPQARHLRGWGCTRGRPVSLSTPNLWESARKRGKRDPFQVAKFAFKHPESSILKTHVPPLGPPEWRTPWHVYLKQSTQLHAELKYFWQWVWHAFIVLLNMGMYCVENT